MLTDGGAIAIFLIVGIIFGAGGIATSFLIHPRRKNPVKFEPYECGVKTIGSSWVQFKVQYFVYALLFVIFDVETIYLYPWAVKFQSLGMFAFVEMIIFIFILVLGLWYAWKEGALEWS
ncbi:NADH-ubiquinone/plastoquinone oxidoreductase chain 3 [Desulfofarcimen acetoxidans DSM 771]|jgi:NADH-quinone oxidoreductase subunit A|uniref:NADH-quinone oxidoreductase subunit A n=1 Tax=Desulfofarcimen acetoxidans (strain ATCC 49208 / DSM 771 / KCTC 5769 / VKM B-1644 / 5575) TaxID=485916 RepID=C8W5A7_DESAS|nr:NADH-quinone oxidoreductase subunit A [Desulfofarcimen acetoxidans]ACV62089.1 NADH-ubiquinone/plastoquinone oxidoreductase chain 3 [Desulfofarcimen acetoxidans DSM 771]